jgi:hypothetical protein
LQTKFEAGEIGQEEFEQKTESARQQLGEVAGETTAGIAGTLRAGAGALIGAPVSAALGLAQPEVEKLGNKIAQEFSEMPEQDQQAVTEAFEKIKQLSEQHPAIRDLSIVALDVAGLAGGKKLAGEVIETAAGQIVRQAPRVERAVGAVAEVGARRLEEGLELVSEAFRKNAVRRAQKSSAQLDEIVGKILQGTKKDIEPSRRALSQLDTSGIKTYEDLKGLTSERITALSSKMDELLDVDKTLFKLDDLSQTTKVGEKEVTRNFVDDAFKHLEESYEKGGFLEDLAEIQNLKDKAISQGLTTRELNQLAREYGTKFKNRSFSPVTGDPKTSVSSELFENTRKGIKNAVRSKVKGDAPKAIDSELSDLFTADRLASKLENSVIKLSQKIKKRGLIERASRAAARAINTLTFGGPRAFLTAFLPSNIGNKVLNSLDMQDLLKVNLKKFNKLNKLTDDNLLKTLDDEIVKRKLTFELPQLPAPQAGAPQSAIAQPIPLP